MTKASVLRRPPISDRNMVVKLLRHSAAKSRAHAAECRKVAVERAAENQPVRAAACVKQALRAEARAARVLRGAEWIERV